MENLKELSKKELIEINGGRIPFAPLNRLNFLWDAAKAGWRFGKYLAG